MSLKQEDVSWPNGRHDVRKCNFKNTRILNVLIIMYCDFFAALTFDRLMSKVYEFNIVTKYVDYFL